jgi:hypothetical protein
LRRRAALDADRADDPDRDTDANRSAHPYIHAAASQLVVGSLMMGTTSVTTGKPLDEAATYAALKWHYKRNGWDENGVPTPETLAELGLEEVRRGAGREGVASRSPVRRQSERPPPSK